MTSSALSSREQPTNPTAQQRAASDPAASVWVNASAGSGKTSILTKRVTRLLLAGVKPQKILCLTFTRAAAAEMSLRVSKELSHWAVCSDNDLNKSLSDLQGAAPSPEHMTRARRLFAESLACPGGMRIRTLHAFGQEILRRFPIESGLPPHFTVIEEQDARDLQNDILMDLLREISNKSNSQLAIATAHLISQLGEKAFRELAQNSMREKSRLTQSIAQHGGLDRLIAHMRLELSLEPDDTVHNIMVNAFRSDVFSESDIRHAAELLQQGTQKYCERGDLILTWLMKSAEDRIASFATYRDCFLTQEGTLFAEYGNKKFIEQHPDLDRILRHEATRLLSLVERCETAEIAGTTAAVLIVSHHLIDRYSARKKLQAILDYDDLVNETLNLLQRPGIAPWILYKLDEGLEHILVDEAQDTSHAQWNIVSSLVVEFFTGTTAQNSNRTLFVVGDEKQSIYSFQNADPAAFAAMRGFFKEKIKAAEKKWEEIPLHVSFRSAPAVLRTVDAVFANPDACDGVSVTPVEHISFKAQTLFGRVEVWPLLPQPENEQNADKAWALPIGYERESDPQIELAEKITTTIKGWLARGEKLPNADYPIRPADIMILLRKRGRFADLMVRALKQKPNDVPVTGVDRMRLMEQLPVMDLLALIQFVLLPEDDLNLATLLRGPLLNLSEDDLMNLAAGRNGLSLWQNLKNVRQIPHIQAIYDYLFMWLGKADYLSPFAMLSQILNEPCPANATSGRKALWSRLGLDALDPIDELLNSAQNFSRRHPPSLQNFLHWLQASDSEIKRELDNGKNSGLGQVRIMTVHASKGLEAPIVFLPDTANLPRSNDVPKFLWDDSTNLPFYLASKPSTGPTRHIWDDARRKQMQEYRRLLYVALTRASHRLYIGGWEPKKKEGDGTTCWHSLVQDGLKASETHATPADKGVIVWEDPALRSATESQSIPTPSNIIDLPLWATKNAPKETVELPTLSPSKLAAMTQSAATPDAAFARGRIIHRLLQSLPDLDAAKRQVAAGRFLRHPQYELTAAQQADVQQEVIKILDHPDFSALFSPTSQAEVPLAGTADGRKISGQVDRLVVLPSEILIVDYKTNRPPPSDVRQIPEAYRAQMEAYRGVLRDIYPDRKIRCFLLWTYGPKLMEVPEKPA